MKSRFTVVFLCVLLCGGLCAGEAENTGNAKKFLARYPDADLNGDGILTREEARAYRAKKEGSPQSRSRTETTGRQIARDKQKIAPKLANVSYGPHSNNVIDFYKARSKRPTPLVLYIHGGGFRGGSKDSISQTTLKELLDAGISVASVEYRFISHKKLPAAHHDCRTAIQFIRTKAKEWNFDKTQVGAFGGSAGAQICMWLAFHDEMADPSSADPVKRESTRLSYVATSGGQITMDLDWWIENIPGYDKHHRDLYESFDAKNKKQLAPQVKEVSVITHLTADDPPIFMRYKQKPDDPVPTDTAKASGWSVHHVNFGIALKEKMDALGIEADLQYPGAKTTYESEADFFKTKFGKK